MSKDFSHFDETGGISMVDVASKRSTHREAVAVATVRMKPATLAKLIEQALPKGDVLTTAKVAGVLAAKATPTLIPLTHPVPLNSIDITFDIDRQGGTIEIRSIVRCDWRTGVEMEAMTACAVAALTTPQFSVISGGLACIAGALVIARLVPEFAKYDAKDAPVYSADGPISATKGEVHG